MSATAGHDLPGGRQLRHRAQWLRRTVSCGTCTGAADLRRRDAEQPEPCAAARRRDDVPGRRQLRHRRPNGCGGTVSCGRVHGAADLRRRTGRPNVCGCTPITDVPCRGQLRHRLQRLRRHGHLRRLHRAADVRRRRRRRTCAAALRPRRAPRGQLRHGLRMAAAGRSAAGHADPLRRAPQTSAWALTPAPMREVGRRTRGPAARTPVAALRTPAAAERTLVAALRTPVAVARTPGTSARTRAPGRIPGSRTRTPERPVRTPERSAEKTPERLVPTPGRSALSGGGRRRLTAGDG